MFVPERCCREIGKPKSWRQCRGRVATIVRRWIAGAHIFLPYCKRHS